MMRRETVEVEEPRLILVATQKVNCHFSAPSRLMVFARNSVFDVGSSIALIQFLPADTLLCQPLSVGVFGPIGLRVMRPMKFVVTIVDASFHTSVCARRQMLLTGQPTHVRLIFEYSADESFGGADCLTVLSTSCRSRIAPRQEGSSTRRTHWTLAVSAINTHSFANEAIDIRCVDERITERVDGVVSLLVRADQQDIWRVHK